MAQHQRSQEAITALVAACGPGPWTTARLRAAGWTPKQMRCAVDAGRLVRHSVGVLGLPGLDGRAALLDRCRAALATSPPNSVISHASAAVLHGLWLPRPPSALTHVTAPGKPDRREHGVRIHGSALPDEHVTELEGLRVTSLARSAVDTARGSSFEGALCVLDSGARQWVRQQTALADALLRSPERRRTWVAASRDELMRAYRSVWPWPGTRVVREALAYVEPASESPFESTSRGVLIDSAITPPLVAVPVIGASGRTYYGDLVWDERRLIGEIDGWSKYGDRATARDVVAAERARQEDLEAAGWRFVRRLPSDSATQWVRCVRLALNEPSRRR